MPRLITRHTNRKLYDPTAKRYVSLADVVDLVVAGQSVRVVEHPGGEDATPRILAQALVDLIKRRAQSLPGGLMETLVRLAGGAKLPQACIASPGYCSWPGLGWAAECCSRPRFTGSDWLWRLPSVRSLWCSAWCATVIRCRCKSVPPGSP